MKLSSPTVEVCPLPNRNRLRDEGVFLFLVCAGLILAGGRAWGQAPGAIARLIPLNSPLTDETLGVIRRSALELQETALRERRQGYLVLEISPGTSPFHHSYALADFLTAQPLASVTTIAWIPKTVTGSNVLVALACNEIVLAPDAALGDLGGGQALPADQQTIVRSIVARHRNARVNEALAVALADPRAALVRLTLESPAGRAETRIVTGETARELRDSGAVILDSKVLLESGSPGLISAQEARAWDVLAAHLAANRRELLGEYGIEPDSLRELDSAGASGEVAFIELHDEIDEAFAAFAERQIERAIQSGAKLIIFEIDSPGGLLLICDDLSRRIAALSDRDIRTVAYIPKQAYSGGAIVALGCDEIYMAPGATIGNAIPINMVGNVILRAEEKALSIELKLLRDLAAAKHRPAALLEKMADKDLEVFEATNKETGRVWYLSGPELQRQAEEWIAGPILPDARAGSALTISGTRANELQIARAPVRDLGELQQRLGLPDGLKLKAIGRTWVDDLVFFLNRNWVTGMLFFLAVVFIYLELATLTGFFGILSAVAFAVFFWSKMLGGTATGLELALFLVGMICLLMEIFVMPGFGVFGVSGTLLVLGSLVMASQTFTGLDLQYDLTRMAKPFRTLTLALLAVAAFSAVISRWLPRLPLLREMVLSPPGDADDMDEPRLRPDAHDPLMPLVGQTGIALTILRPAGKARIADRLIDVISDGPFIEEGAAIRVIHAAGNHVVVREC